MDVAGEVAKQKVEVMMEGMMDGLLPLLFVGVWLGTTLALKKLLARGRVYWVEAWLWMAIIGWILLPLIVLRVHVDLGVKLTLANTTLVLAAIGAIALGARRLWLQENRQMPEGTRMVGWDTAMFMVSIVIGMMMMGRWWFNMPQPVPGADTSVYLAGVATISATGSLAHGFDRSLVYLLIQMFGWGFGGNVQLGLRVLVFGMYLGNGWVVYAMVRRLINRYIGGIAMVMILVNWAVLRLALDIYANFLAALMLLLIFWVWLLIERGGLSWRIGGVVIAVVWASLFQTHGIMAFGSLGLIGVPVALHWLRSDRKIGGRRNWRQALIMTSIWVWLGLPLNLSGWRHVSSNFIQPWWQQLDRETEEVLPILNEKEELIVEQERTVFEQLGLDQKRVEGRRVEWIKQEIAFREYFPLSWMGVAIIGLGWTLKKSWRRKGWWVGWMAFSGAFLVLSQHEWLGVKWYSTRFVMSLYGVVVVWGVVGLVTIKRWLSRVRWSKLLVAGLALLLVVPSWSKNQARVRSYYQPLIGQEEYQFFQVVADVVNPETDLLLSTSLNLNWQKTLMPRVTVWPIHVRAVCGDELIIKEVGDVGWQLGQALSEGVSSEESVKALREMELGKEHVFIFVDSRNGCLDLKKLTWEPFEVVSRTENFFLVKVY